MGDYEGMNVSLMVYQNISPKLSNKVMEWQGVMTDKCDTSNLSLFKRGSNAIYHDYFSPVFLSPGPLPFR